MAANYTKYCVIGNVALLLQVIVADCFEKVPEICSDSRMKNKLN